MLIPHYNEPVLGSKLERNLDRSQYQDSSVDGSAIFTSSIVRSIGPSVGATIDQIDQLSLSEVGGLNELATPWYSDQVLPFDITLSAANEYGAMTAAKIFGVEILNEGSGISIDDAVTESSATFAARSVEPLQAVASKFDGGIGGSTLPTIYIAIRPGTSLSPPSARFTLYCRLPTPNPAPAQQTRTLHPPRALLRSSPVSSQP